MIEVDSSIFSPKQVKYDFFDVKYVVKKTNCSYNNGLGKQDIGLKTHVGGNLHCQYQMITAQMQSKD